MFDISLTLKQALKGTVYSTIQIMSYLGYTVYSSMYSVRKEA